MRMRGMAKIRSQRSEVRDQGLGYGVWARGEGLSSRAECIHRGSSMLGLDGGILAGYFVDQGAEEGLGVGDDADGLDAAAVRELGDGGRVDVHASDFYPSRQQV